MRQGVREVKQMEEKERGRKKRERELEREKERGRKRCEKQLVSFFSYNKRILAA